jgi:WD40 repeat protein
MPWVGCDNGDCNFFLGASDGIARLWDRAKAKPIGPPLELKPNTYVPVLSSNAKIVAAISFKEVRLLDTSTGRATGAHFQHSARVSAVGLSADARFVMTACQDKTVRLWEKTSSQSGPLKFLISGQVVALSADGKSALTGGTDKTTRLWNAKSRDSLAPPLVHKATVAAVALEPQGKFALVLSAGEARLWDLANRAAIGPPFRCIGSAVALSANSKLAVTMTDWNQARIWDTASGKTLGAPLSHGKAIAAVGFSADGKTVMTGGYDFRVRFWDSETGKQTGTPLQLEWTVAAIAVSADGKMGIVGCDDYSARFWNIATGRLIGSALHHENRVRAVAISEDGRIALTGSFDKTAQLWEMATGKPIGKSLHHGDAVYSVALSADGMTAATGSRENKGWFLRLPRFASDPERIALWAQVVTGIEADEHGNARALSADEWQRRRDRLAKLGGSPLLE